MNEQYLACNVIDHGFSERVIGKLLEWEDAHNKTPIEPLLIINSRGGSLTDAWAIIDVMQNIKVPITTVALGSVESAALAVFTAGDKRYSYKHTTFLAHDFIWPIPEGQTPNYSALKERRVPEDFIQSQLEEFYLANTKLSKHQVQNVFKREGTFFSVHQAKKWGFVHKVINDRKK